MSATLGLDDSAYRQGVEEAKSQTKAAVSTMMKDYNRLYSEVIHLTAAYQKSRKETGETSEKTKEFAQKLKEAQAQLNTTAQGLRTAEAYMSSFGDATGKASKANKSLAEELTASITKGMTLSNVILKAGSAAIDAAKNFVQSGIEYNAQIEKYTTGFTNMLGSAEAAQQVMSQIQEDAAKTPFNVESLTKANQYLISAGENASYARNTIMALGDAVSATGGGNDELNRMAQNLQQIANTGKATAADIKQFAYAGIDVYGILADYTGKSTTEVQNMTISYDLLTQALQAASEEGGRYYSSMDTQSQTMNGRMSTLKDNVKQLAGLLTGDLSSGIGVAIGKLNDMVVAAQEAYKLDGWKGLIGEITGLTTVIDKAKSSAAGLKAVFDALKSGEIGIFHGDWDAVYQKAFNNDYQNKKAGKKDTNYWKEYGERLKKQYGIKETNSSSIVTTGGGSGSSGGKRTGSSGSRSTAETVISSISSTATTTAQNALGTVTTSIQTLTEKVKDSSGKIKDRITETTTTTGKEMVNGVATTFKQVEIEVNGKVTKVTKTYDDMSKTILGTLTSVSETTFNGITTKIQEIVKTAADGSTKTEKVITETGEDVVDGVRQNVTTITKIAEDGTKTIEKSLQKIDTSVKGTQSRIDQQLSEASGQLDKGIFGLVKNTFKDAKNGDWASLGLDFVNLIWGEVSQEQRDVISKWLTDALTAVNEGYSSGGISKALGSIQSIFTNGITAGVDGATTSVKAFSEIVSGLAGSGGVGGTLGSIVQGFSGMAGSITSSLGSIVSFIMSNPVLALILGVGAVAGGIGLAMWMNKNKKDDTAVSHYQSPFDKTGVYDSLGTFSTRAALQYRVTGRQSIVDRQTSILERIEGMLDEHLPNIGKGAVFLDGDKVGDMMSPRMATNVDARIGVTVTRKARGVL
mgnify:CR=1 FL=1